MASDDASVTVELTTESSCSPTAGEDGGSPRVRGGEAHVFISNRQMSTTKDVIISVREKHGSFRSAVPCMPMSLALVCCLFNIFLPGVGTFLSSFSVFCCGFTRISSQRAFLWNLLAAVLQTVTCIFIVGWIWSISWGMTFCTLATEYKYEKQVRGKQHQSARWTPT
ncbi:protein stum homolog [Acanthaster planci]|uniref:Protein stum homolog n=1 Tax=Acanthaster planci TaxID=133434 RepID=A0A8B7Z6T0_ACAPL|nr:protein stum homolog [Acanthaster planci]